MLNDLQTWMAPYLDLLGDHPWAKALVIIVVFLVLAWIFDRFISATLKNLTARTRFKFDDQLIDYLHSPVYVSVILIGMALAVNLLAIAEPFESILYSSLQTIAYLVWTLFLMRVVRSALRAVAVNEKRLAILHPQTLPLFENIAADFKSIVTFPAEAIDGLSDEQYIRNVVDALYRTKTSG